SLESSQVAAIIYEESKFDPDVVSSQDAIGLMQVLPDTANLLARDLGVDNLWRDDLFVPSINIKFGTYYYRELLDKYNGDVDLALAAYNAGFGAVDKADRKINNLPKETQEFVKRVKKTEKIYQRLYWQELGADRGDLSFEELTGAVWNKIIKTRKH
ncbi:MAG: lytic transglycosylase, partial [Candidatus Berkelbacteria bacterium Licking1014_96]